MIEERTVTLGEGELAVLTRQATALETIAENSTSIVSLFTRLVGEMEKMNDRMGDKDLGVYMNPNMKEDRHKGTGPVGQAAFDVSMEEANKVDKVKHRLKDPIDWSE